MDTIHWLSPILNILAILCIITGLYIAGRFLPAFIAWMRSFYPGDLLSRQFPKIILWLALGALFTSPLLDFVSSLGILINETLAPQGVGEFSTLLGTVSTRVYLSFPLLLMIVVYATVIFYGFEYMTSSAQFNPAERIFIVLAIASLVFGAINSVFTQVMSFQIPFLVIQQNFGIAGYLVELLVALTILMIILFALNRFLFKRTASKHE